VTAFEHYVRALAAPDVDRAVASLDAALDAAGEVAWLRTARFVTLAGARRTGEALADVERALDLDPLDTRTLYFRASTRRLLGDRRAARLDLQRVLERRPSYVGAVEDLVRILVDDGRPADALAALGAFEAVDPQTAATERVRSLRRGAETALVRGATSATDLLALAKSPVPETRRKVAVALPGFQGDDAEAALRALLADPDEGVRVTAVRGYLRPWLRARAAEDPALLAALLRLLSGDPAETVRSAAATALGSLEAPTACEAVAARLVGASRDASSSVRAAAADALSGRDVAASRAALVAALSDEDLEVRRAAIASLHRIASTTFDYAPDDPAEKRAPAVARWQAWAREPR
jgi:hypothetical protein